MENKNGQHWVQNKHTVTWLEPAGNAFDDWPGHTDELYKELESERNALTGLWEFKSIDRNDQESAVHIKSGQRIAIANCGGKLCLYPVIGNTCRANALKPYPKARNEQRGRVYILRLKGLQEPHYVSLTQTSIGDDGEEDQSLASNPPDRRYDLMIEGASFSFYRRYDSMASSEAGLAFEARWRFVGRFPCHRTRTK